MKETVDRYASATNLDQICNRYIYICLYVPIRAIYRVSKVAEFEYKGVMKWKK